MKTITLMAGLLLLGGTAQAHVVLDQQEAVAGSMYKAVLKVGHGCDGSATRQLTITLPPGFSGAKPVPKAGWTLALRSEKLATPYESHGVQITEAVVEISWTARSEADYLQDAWYDEFTLRGSLPAQPGELWFKVRQTCVKGESNWAEVPAAGATSKGLKMPAARLLVTPAGAMPGQAHQH